jgi:hypothetical protein
MEQTITINKAMEMEVNQETTCPEDKINKWHHMMVAKRMAKIALFSEIIL